MSDRTPEQREAARRERELRRAAKEGRAPAQPVNLDPVLPSRPEPDPEPEAVGPPPAPASEPEAGGPEPGDVAPDHVSAAPAEPAQTPADDAVANPAPADPAPPVRTPTPVAFGLAAAGTSGPRHEYQAAPGGAAGPGPDEDPGGYDFETGEHEFEAPAGTRRVSHRDSGRAGRAERHVPRLRRGRGGRGPNAAPTQGGRSWRGRLGALVALVVAAALIWFVVQLFQPLHGSSHGQITVTVPAKATSSQIGDLLARDGVIDSSFFFQLRATLAGERSDLRSGVYHLQLGMAYGAVLTALTQAPPAARVSSLTITEGRTRQYVAARLKAQHLGSSYLAATRRSPQINWHAYGLRHTPPTLEGVLFPDTYQLVDPVRVSALVKDQITAFKTNFARLNLGYARRKHLTPYDVVTIASLVEAEAANVRDRPLVASVVYNRLAAGMLLQFDSTTRYATGNYNNPLTVSELHSRSRWNTHTHLGLPPTPIDSPGLAALQAAAHPAQTNNLFFFARHCGGSTVFTATYSQFLNDEAKDQRHHC
ncbi:MAG: endolytic transglycosylase MltG [Solirubrobacteraceae bacterium]